MPAGLYDMLCEQGATFTRVITWKDSAGDIVNLSGFTARMQVRSTVKASSTLVSLTSENGGLVFKSPRSLGQVEIVLTATATADLTPGTYVYDLELVSFTGVVTRLIEGKFIVKAEVTR